MKNINSAENIFGKQSETCRGNDIRFSKLSLLSHNKYAK